MRKWSDQPVSTSMPEVDVPERFPVGDYAVADRLESAGATKIGQGPRRRVAGVVVGVLALVATGLAVTQLTAADGAKDPEAAVQALFDAVEAEDAVGVLESLSPSERDVLVPSLRKLAGQLSRVDVADGAVDLEKVGGVDVEIAGLTLRTQGLHPDVAAVKVTGGTVDVAGKLGDLPLGKALSGALKEEGGLDLGERRTVSAPIDVTLVTVRSAEGWHVSLLYSLAEAERVASGAPVPDFGHGIAAAGAASPRAAVDAMVDAFNNQDLGRMIELTPPDSMSVLHDYGPAWVEAAAEDIEDDGTRSAYRMHLEDVVVGAPEGSGDTRRMSLDGYRYVTSWGDQEVDAQIYDGSCMAYTYGSDGYAAVVGGSEPEEEPASDKQCVGDAAFDRWRNILAGGVFAPVGPLLFNPGQADIVVVERGGLWYVDPVRTIVDTLLLNVKASTPDQMKDMVRIGAVWLNEDEDAWLASMGAEFYESCRFVDVPAADASFEERREAGRRCREERSSTYGDTEATSNGAVDAEEACYATYADPAGLEACLDEVRRGAGLSGEATPEGDLCPENAVEGATGSCLDPDEPGALVEQRVMRCYEAGDTTAIDACLQEMVDAQLLPPDELADFRCKAVYEAIPSDVSDQEYERAGEIFAQCMVDAGFDPEQHLRSRDGTDAPTATTVAPPTTG